jgi:hypothetical protein
MDLPEVEQDEMLHVFDNLITGTARIVSVTNVNNFKEFNNDQFTDGYIMKLQSDTTRGRKIPFSTIYLRVPDVPKSIIHYRPGASVFFYGSLVNCFNGGKILLDSFDNLPIFIQSNSMEQGAQPRPQGFAKFKRSKFQSPSPAKKSKNDQFDDDEVVVKIEPGTGKPTTPPSTVRTNRLAKKPKFIVVSDDEVGSDENEEHKAQESEEEEVIDLTKDSDDEFIDDSEVLANQD